VIVGNRIAAVEYHVVPMRNVIGKLEPTVDQALERFGVHIRKLIGRRSSCTADLIED
jgi:hypothetical protein